MDEYLAEQQIPLLLNNRIDYTGRIAVKTSYAPPLARPQGTTIVAARLKPGG